MSLNKNIEQSDWFVNWFDSPYYHILYNKRNDEEALLFIKNLCNFLQLPNNSSLLDLACGKGRHAITLNKLGYEVTGVDLSSNSIQYAKQFENNTLKFIKHDIRELLIENKFDAVFNLFTSIGYFENENDNSKVFENVYSSLKDKGIFVIDFFNANCVIKNLKPNETKTIDGIEFSISKTIHNNKVIKNIQFSYERKKHVFEEKVYLYKEENFLSFAKNTGFSLIQVFGDYQLNPFDINSSERLILIFKK